LPLCLPYSKRPTLRRRLALWAVAHFPLVLSDLPYTPNTVDIEMVCDQSADRDEGLQWLIDELAASMSGKI